MIILLFISHCGCTVIQLLHTVLAQLRRRCARGRVLCSLDGIARWNNTAVSLRKTEGKRQQQLPPPPPLPLTLHHPLPSFCSSKDTNGINEGINYRGGKSCWVIHLANMQTTMGILQQLSWAWLTLSVVNTAKMQHRPASLSHSVQCPFTDGYKIKSIAAYSLTLKQRESLLIRVQTCDSNYCAALNCA